MARLARKVYDWISQIALVKKRNGDPSTLVRTFAILFDRPRESLLGSALVSQGQMERYAAIRSCTKITWHQRLPVFQS